ncbi:MAG: imidazole glycerol phosphate synthase subunit HisH [Methanothrix sp.]
MIAIVDYGMGNLFSIYNALLKAGGDPEIMREPEFRDAAGIIIPGVGSFGRCMESLRRFQEPLEERIAEGTPVLGICIGMQVMMDESEESPGARGFGWIPGRVVRLPEGVTVPQMGWNSLEIKRHLELLDGISPGDMFYFVHSYHCIPYDQRVVVATTLYGVEVAAVVAKDNIYGTQFHPEKSGPKGLRILENFVRMVRC